MKNLRLTCVRLLKFHVIVRSGTDVLHILHIIIDTFDHMMTRGTHRYEILFLLLRRIQRTNGRQLRRDLVRTKRIDPAAALPVFDLF